MFSTAIVSDEAGTRRMLRPSFSSTIMLMSMLCTQN